MLHPCGRAGPDAHAHDVLHVRPGLAGRLVWLRPAAAATAAAPLPAAVARLCWVPLLQPTAAPAAATLQVQNVHGRQQKRGARPRRQGAGGLCRAGLGTQATIAAAARWLPASHAAACLSLAAPPSLRPLAHAPPPSPAHPRPCTAALHIARLQVLSPQFSRGHPLDMHLYISEQREWRKAAAAEQPVWTADNVGLAEPGEARGSSVVYRPSPAVQANCSVWLHAVFTPAGAPTDPNGAPQAGSDGCRGRVARRLAGWQHQLRAAVPRRLRWAGHPCRSQRGAPAPSPPLPILSHPCCRPQMSTLIAQARSHAPPS